MEGALEALVSRSKTSKKEFPMQLEDLHVGDAVTCREPVGVYSYYHTFEPGFVGFIAHIDRHRPAQVLADFYYKIWPDPSHYEQTIYRCCLSIKNVRKIPNRQAKAYLWEHAPTWEEHVTSLIRWYHRLSQVGQVGQEEPTPHSSAHKDILLFLANYPTQQ